jgi:hypothetical protein
MVFFSYQKSKYGYTLERLGMEKFGIQILYTIKNTDL